MTRSERIISNLPALRRYAVATTGSLERGDELIRACLETVVASPERTRQAEDRVGLFSLFHEIVGVPPVNPPSGAMADDGAQAALLVRIGLIDGEARAALILVSVIGLSLAETAGVLDRASGEVQRLLAEARQQLVRMAGAHVLIIEDDVVIAHDISRIVERLGQRVSGPAATYDEAMALAAQHAPTLVLADIELRDGQTAGLLAGRALARQHQIPLILLTAYPERLIQSAEPEPLRVFTKPFNYASLKEAITSTLTGQAVTA